MPRSTSTSTNTVSDICNTTPSQTQGIGGNLERRVAAIEAVLSRLLGGDVSANQLSDLSGSGGVITDVIAVASNAAGGWTTDGTFTGVAISTLGWTMSDGKPYPIVQMVDGVLQYGFSKDGTIGGTSSSASGQAQMAVFNGSGVPNVISTPAPINWVASSEGGVNDSAVQTLGPAIRIMRAGKYALFFKCIVTRSGSTDADFYGEVLTNVSGFGARLSYLYEYFPASPSVGLAAVLAPNAHLVHRFPADAQISMRVSKAGSATLSFSNCHLTVVFLG